jgi:hypothetical protein
MSRAKHEHDVWNVEHNPRYPHDCSRCKFSWNCGPSCACELQHQLKYHKLGCKSSRSSSYAHLTEAPMNVKLWANQFTHDDWKDHNPFNTAYGLPYPELEDETESIDT